MTRLLVALAVFLIPAAAAQVAKADGAVTSAKLPCSDNGQGGLRPCSIVVADMQRLVQARVQEQADGKYDGCDRNDSMGSTCSNGQKGVNAELPICNIYSGQFNGNAETDSNHKGQSCGSWANFSAWVSGRSCQVGPNFTGQYHRREEGYMRGMEMHAYDCHFSQVRSEIQNHTLEMTYVSNSSGAKTPGPCAYLAKDFQARSSEFQASLQASLSNKLNLKDIDNCAGGNTVDPAHPDQGGNRQSACQLYTMRQALEAVFMQMATCEVLYRSQLSFQRFLGVNQTQQSVDQEMMNFLNSQMGTKSQCNPGNVQNIYSNHYMQTLHGRADQIWPSSVCNAPQPEAGGV